MVGEVEMSASDWCGYRKRMTTYVGDDSTCNGDLARLDDGLFVILQGANGLVFALLA